MKAIFSLLFLLSLLNATMAQVKPLIISDPVSKTAQLAEEEKAFSAPFFGNAREAAPGGYTIASSNFDVNFYRCEWKVDPAVRYITGKVTSYFTMTAAGNTIIYDFSDTLTVDSVTYHGKPTSFQRPGNDGISISFPASLAAGQKDSISIYYQGVPRKLATTSTYMAFRQGVHNGTPAGIPEINTLSEPYGPRDWWPCKNGLNDKPDSLDIVVTHPDSYQASTNGVMVSQTSSGGITTSYWKHRYPIASYLVALAVTNFATITDTVLVGGKSMNLISYVYPGYEGYWIYYLPPIKIAMNLFGSLLGDYPFAKEKYGITQWRLGGGMEHQTNSFVGNGDAGLLIHELAHHWFGDKITCGSWQDTWLNEGFATYLQILYNEHINGPYIHYLTLDNFRNDIISLPGGSVWVDDTTSLARTFDSRLTYEKGGYLLHMLRWKLGDSMFFRGLRSYFYDTTVAFKYSRTADVIRNMQQQSGRDLTSFFQKWFYGQGYPTYNVQWTQDDSNLAFVKINQVTSHPSVSFFDLPLEVEFRSSTRDTFLVFDYVKNNQSFLAKPGFHADTILIDPHFWIVSGNNTQANTSCGAVDPSDSSLPFYTINWMQNSNNWVNLNISQSNKAVLPFAEDIPLYLHFSGAGKDTIIGIKDLRYSYNGWLNIGFKASNVFVVPGSCLLAGSFKVSGNNATSGANEISIFPIPVINNSFSISLKNPSDKTLDVLVYNTAGQRVYKGQFDTPGSDELFTVRLPASLPRGTYIVRLYSEKSIHLNRKIMK